MEDTSFGARQIFCKESDKNCWQQKMFTTSGGGRRVLLDQKRGM